MTKEQILAEVTRITNLITQLQKQLASLKPGTLSPTSTDLNTWCHTFSTAIKYKDRGYEVGALQAALKKDGVYSGSIGGYSAVFGQQTLNAVIAFQEKYKDEILIPFNMISGTGYVGASTIKKLNQLFGCP